MKHEFVTIPPTPPPSDKQTVSGVEGCRWRSTSEIQKCTVSGEDDVHSFFRTDKGLVIHEKYLVYMPEQKNIVTIDRYFDTKTTGVVVPWRDFSSQQSPAPYCLTCRWAAEWSWLVCFRTSTIFPQPRPAWFSYFFRVEKQTGQDVVLV